MTEFASAARIGGGASRRQSWTRWRARLSFAAHPEALPLALSFAAWVVLIASREPQARWGLICTARRPLDGWATGLAFLGHQSVMLVAMMLPLVLFQVRHVVTHSYARRQMRGALAFMAGYLTPWLAATLAVAPLTVFAGAAAPMVQGGLTMAIFIIAAVWQLTALKTDMLSRCARTAPLRQDGWRADRACLAYGAMTARDCMATCWAPMLAALIRPHDLLIMAVVQIIALSERSMLRPRPMLAALVLAVTGGLTVALG